MLVVPKFLVEITAEPLQSAVLLGCHSVAHTVWRPGGLWELREGKKVFNEYIRIARVYLIPQGLFPCTLRCSVCDRMWFIVRIWLPC